jgi:Arc/MetJ family transcription regulator
MIDKYTSNGNVMCIMKKTKYRYDDPTSLQEAPAIFGGAPAEMRTNIVLEEALVAEAQALTGIKTKSGVVHHALREVVRRARQKEILGMRGQVKFWDGYVEEQAAR